MLSSIYFPFVVGLNIILFVFNDLYVCLFIVTKIGVKISVIFFPFSQMTCMEILRLKVMFL